MISHLEPSPSPVVPDLESHEVTYAKDQPEYNPLRTLRSYTAECRVLSRWTLTDEQRQALLNGADIYLELMTFRQPLQPIRLFISDGIQLEELWDEFGQSVGKLPEGDDPFPALHDENQPSDEAQKAAAKD